MRIGIPRERKDFEGRVVLVPAACADLIAHGHQVFIESGAGRLSGFDDQAYRTVGVEVLADGPAVYEAGELIVKVKEPVDEELPWLRREHLLFCYLHLAANESLTKRLVDIGLTAVAFETVQEGDGSLPLLAPMSDIAGRLATQVGTHLLHIPQGGKGLLLGGLPGARRGRVVIIGAGVAGGNAAVVAAALGAEVTVFDRQRGRLEHMRALGPNVTALYPYGQAVSAAVRQADLVIGAVLIPGTRAPHVVDADTVRRMEQGSVIIDISVDQGGCIETTRPTTYAQPTYVWEGIVHFAVTNMPGAVPHSATEAISAAVLPFLLRLAGDRWRDIPALAAGVNVQDGRVTHPALL
jgi:alanine dehydrogenase